MKASHKFVVVAASLAFAAGCKTASKSNASMAKASTTSAIDGDFIVSRPVGKEDLVLVSGACYDGQPNIRPEPADYAGITKSAPAEGAETLEGSIGFRCKGGTPFIAAKRKLLSFDVCALTSDDKERCFSELRKPDYFHVKFDASSFSHRIKSWHPIDGEQRSQTAVFAKPEGVASGFTVDNELFNELLAKLRADKTEQLNEQCRQRANLELQASCRLPPPPGANIRLAPPCQIVESDASVAPVTQKLQRTRYRDDDTGIEREVDYQCIAYQECSQIWHFENYADMQGKAKLWHGNVSNGANCDAVDISRSAQLNICLSLEQTWKAGLGAPEKIGAVVLKTYPWRRTNFVNGGSDLPTYAAESEKDCNNLVANTKNQVVQALRQDCSRKTLPSLQELMSKNLTYVTCGDTAKK